MRELVYSAGRMFSMGELYPDKRIVGVKLLPKDRVHKYNNQMNKYGFISQSTITKKEAREALKNGAAFSRWTQFDERIHKGEI